MISVLRYIITAMRRIEDGYVSLAPLCFPSRDCCRAVLAVRLERRSGCPGDHGVLLSVALVHPGWSGCRLSSCAAVAGTGTGPASFAGSRHATIRTATTVAAKRC